MERKLIISPLIEKDQNLSQSTVKIIRAGADIDAVPPAGDDLTFMHAILCQVGLPRAKVEGSEFMRRSGAAWISVQAGYLDEGSGPILQPVPYGVMPRLALATVSTYAIRNKSREIPLGDSAAEFLRFMGMDRQGARYAVLRKQMHAMAACRLQLGFNGRTYNGQPVQQFDAWISNKKISQRSLWPGVMTLSQDYYNSLIESAVPLDCRAIIALKGSSLALDIYTWLAHRLFRIEGKGVLLHWRNLQDQFGQEYGGPNADKSFKKAFLLALEKVLTVYPQANLRHVKGGLLLLGSPTPINPRNRISSD